VNRIARAASIGAVVGWSALAACNPAPPAAPPRSAAPETVARAVTARQAPPPPGAPQSIRLRHPSFRRLERGLLLGVVETPDADLCEVRLVIRSGRASDEAKPGLASLAAAAIVHGGGGEMTGLDWTQELAAIGATLSAHTSLDHTLFELTALPEHVARAIDLLAAAVTRPRFDDFDRIQRFEIERQRRRAATSSEWAQRMVLWRDLFRAPVGLHAYAVFDALPEDLRARRVEEVRAFHRAAYVASNAAMWVSGPTSPAEIEAIVGSRLGSLGSSAAPVVSFGDAPLPPERRVTVLHRPDAPESIIAAGWLGPPRSEPGWAAFEALPALVTGDSSSRMLEQPAAPLLTGATRASWSHLADGPSVFIVHVRTPTARTGEAARALLDHLNLFAVRPPSDDEVRSAVSEASGQLAMSIGSARDLADHWAAAFALDLPDDDLETLAGELARTAGGDLEAALARLLAGRPILAVWGDADVIDASLLPFGDVKVVDPTRGFARLRTLAKDPKTPMPPSESP
jgi:zinc protease